MSASDLHRAETLMTAPLKSTPATRAATPQHTRQLILPASGSRNTISRSRLAKYLPPVIVFGVAIGIWYLVSEVLLAPNERFLLPTPHQVVRVGFLQWGNLKEILEGLKSTGLIALYAFVISGVLGTLFAVLMSEAKWIERSFYPFAVTLQTLPVLAMVPLIGFWLGFGTTSRIVVAIMMAIFPVITNALFGLQSVDKEHRDLFRLHTRSRLVRLIKLKFPAALPSIFTGLRISAGLSVIASIVADFFIRNGEPGIGSLIVIYSSQLEGERLLASLAVTSLLGLAVFWLVGLVRNLVIGRWHSSSRSETAE